VRRTGLGWLAVAALALVPAACGGDDPGGDAGSGGGSRDEGTAVDIRGVGLMSGNSTAQFANCRDWRSGTPERRYATIEDIRGQLTPQVSRSEESDLSDRQTYGIFQRVCANDFSDELRLYKLYMRAQAFAPLTKGSEPDSPN
jgi:hypothetical protein